MTGVQTCALPIFCTPKILYAYTDEPVSDAIDRMATRGLRQLPVCDRALPEKILGLLDKDSILSNLSVTQAEESLKPYLNLGPSPNLNPEISPNSNPDLGPEISLDDRLALGYDDTSVLSTFL